jgi:transcriptional regulator PpsR
MPVISPEVLSQVISTASDITLNVDKMGIVSSVLVNPHCKPFGDLSRWLGAAVRGLLTVESVPKLDRRLEQLAEAPAGTSLVVEVNHTLPDGSEFPIRYSLHRLPNDSSVLMMGRDLRPVADVQQKLVSVQLALERDHEAQREMDTRYRVLMEMTQDAVLLVSMSTGRIIDLNANAASLMGSARSDLVGAALAQEFVGRRRGELLEAMSNIATADAASPIELQTRRSLHDVLMVPVMFRAAGERLMLCRLDQPEEAAGNQGELSEGLVQLFHEGVDGIVFADRDGFIKSANDAFLELTNATNVTQLRGRSLAEFLVRGSVDLKVLLENARRTGRMRMYSTQVLTVFQAQVPVEISVSWLSDRPNPQLALIFRDASRAEAMRRPASAQQENIESVVGLVGSSKLKDIVAETADVVERLCIETAVQMTRNNRVAAAEMLGLSRQSLYVKLRKYGLVDKDAD